jgi:hypothetical protein
MTAAPVRTRPARSWSARARSVRGWSARTRESRPRSTTRRTLLRLLAGLLALTATVFASTLLTFTRVHRTAETVRTHTAPAIAELAAARLALVKADAAVIDSLTPEVQASGVKLTGPSEELQSQLTLAGQALTRVAEHNVAGESASRHLQLVEGQLVTYQVLVGQADAHFRQVNGKALGAADLWGASRLLHGEVVTQQDRSLGRLDGILRELDQLTGDQQQALDKQLAASAVTPVAVLAVLVPLLGLFGLLLATQLALRRRFRRRINPWLLLATGLLLAMAAISTSSAVAQHRIEDSRGTLRHLVADRQQRGSAEDTEGQHALNGLLHGIPCAAAGGCGHTVKRFADYVTRLPAASGRITDRRLTAEVGQVSAQTAAATAGAGLEPVIYVLAILTAAAVFLGFLPRLSEYRYRPR